MRRLITGPSTTFDNSSGRTWQTDCYPTAGALIRMYNLSGACLTDRFWRGMPKNKWPFLGTHDLQRDY